FLKTLRLNFFNFLGYPAALNQIKHHDAADENSQQDLTDVTEVANQPQHGAAEKITDAAEDENPKETTNKRKRHKTQVGHACNPIKRARRPAQSVNVFRNEDREGAESVRHALQSWLRVTIKPKVAHSTAENAAGSVG